MDNPAQEPVLEETTVSNNEGKARGRGKETLFRVTMRNQIDQIAIADNKANLIISINTIIISLVVAILGTGVNITGLPFLKVTQISLPLTILMISSTTSAIFSLLAAKPRIIRGVPDFKKSSLLFFGNFKHMSLNEYIDEMDEILSSNQNIYRNLVIDVYNYGMILSHKYRFLNISYTAFLIGLIFCVGTYLVLISFQL